MISKITDEMKPLLNEYFDKFKEVFPLLEYTGNSPEDFIEDVKNCISQNKSYIDLHPGMYKAGMEY